MNVCHQWPFFAQEGDVDLRSIPPELHLAALNFAATTMEVHERRGDKGKRVLTGRILDALKAENGFASVREPPAPNISRPSSQFKDQGLWRRDESMLSMSAGCGTDAEDRTVG